MIKQTDGARSLNDATLALGLVGAFHSESPARRMLKDFLDTLIRPCRAFQELVRTNFFCNRLSLYTQGVSCVSYLLARKKEKDEPAQKSLETVGPLPVLQLFWGLFEDPFYIQREQ